MFLEQALNTLDKKERELIYLRFFQDRTREQYCRGTGYVPGTGFPHGEKNFKAAAGKAIKKQGNISQKNSHTNL